MTSQFSEATQVKPVEDCSRAVFNGHDETDMTEMLNELRILLPGAQLLNGFLIALPFTSGFRQIVQLEKWIFMATFLCSLSSLILFTAPAVQHRVLRPLEDRVHFKDVASIQMLTGAFFLSLSLVLCASLVIAEVVGHPAGLGVGAVFASMILVLWWLYPWFWKRRNSIPAASSSKQKTLFDDT